MAGEVRHVAVRSGKAWCGAEWRGKAGMARHGKVWQGMAWQGLAG